MIIKERIFVSLFLSSQRSLSFADRHMLCLFTWWERTNSLTSHTSRSIFVLRSLLCSLKNSENLSGSKYPHCTLIFLEIKHLFLSLFAPKQATGCCYVKNSISKSSYQNRLKFFHICLAKWSKLTHFSKLITRFHQGLSNNSSNLFNTHQITTVRNLKFLICRSFLAQTWPSMNGTLCNIATRHN